MVNLWIFNGQFMDLSIRWSLIILQLIKMIVMVTFISGRVSEGETKHYLIKTNKIG